MKPSGVIKRGSGKSPSKIGDVVAGKIMKKSGDFPAMLDCQVQGRALRANFFCQLSDEDRAFCLYFCRPYMGNIPLTAGYISDIVYDIIYGYGDPIKKKVIMNAYRGVPQPWPETSWRMTSRERLRLFSVEQKTRPKNMVPRILLSSPKAIISYASLGNLLNPLTVQWEVQDPKMEVLYHIRPYFLGGYSLT